MSENVKVGYVIAPVVKEKLSRLAVLDRRSMSGEIEWMVDEEWKRRGLEEADDGSDGSTAYSSS